MNALYLMVLWLFQLAAQQTGSCSPNKFNLTVKNAFISCPTNASCNAECYRGFIFPTGQTDRSFSCPEGAWTPELSACKVIPDVYVSYSTMWNFTDIIPYFCENISSHLNTLIPILEDTFANQCRNSIIHRSVKFTFSMLAFTITGHFFFKYRNFTNWNILDRCTNLTFYSLKKSPVLWTIFNNVTCNNSRVNYKIARELYLLDRHAVCLNGMDIFNVTVPIDEYFELYCDIKLTVLTTEVTGEGHTSNSSNLENTTFLQVTKPKGIVPYVAAVGGLIMISFTVIFVVFFKKRLKSPTKLLREIEIPYITNNFHHEFKGELIENKLYQSADDVVDSHSDHHDTESSVNGSPAEPYYKNLQTKLETEEDFYSYASHF